MAAFKQHGTFGFWRGAAVVDQAGRSGEEAMGQFGRITRVEDLPPDGVLVGYVHKAIAARGPGARARRPAGGLAPRRALP